MHPNEGENNHIEVTSLVNSDFLSSSTLQSSNNSNINQSFQNESFISQFSENSGKRKKNQENSKDKEIATNETNKENSKMSQNQNFEKQFAHFHSEFYREIFDLFNTLLENSDHDKCLIYRKDVQKLMKYFNGFKDYQINYQSFKKSYEQLKEQQFEFEKKISILLTENRDLKTKVKENMPDFKY